LSAAAVGGAVRVEARAAQHSSARMSAERRAEVKVMAGSDFKAATAVRSHGGLKKAPGRQ
jgi:hypothetical protein